MKIAIDAFRLVCETRTSGHTYAKELACSLAAAPTVSRVLLIVPAPPSEDLRTIFQSLPKIIFLIDDKLSNPARSWIDQTRWIQTRLPRILNLLPSDDRPDGFIAPFHQTPVFVMKDICVAAVIHDLCGLDPESGYRKWRWLYIKHVINFWTARRRADTILPISEFTKRALVTKYPDVASRVTPPAYNTVTSTCLENDVVKSCIERLALPENYFLAFSASGPRKGTDISLAAYKEYQIRGGQAALVLLGGTSANEHWKLFADRSGIQNIKWLSGVSDTERDAIYASAKALVFPSRCEGFGYPIVEAMRQGCPVIATTASPAEEIIDKCMPTLGSLATDGIADEMGRYTHMSPSERTRLKSQLILKSQRFHETGLGDAFVDAIRSCQTRTELPKAL